jgi:hypothetical protein
MLVLGHAVLRIGYLDQMVQPVMVIRSGVIPFISVLTLPTVSYVVSTARDLGSVIYTPAVTSSPSFLSSETARKEKVAHWQRATGTNNSRLLIFLNSEYFY